MATAVLTATNIQQGVGADGKRTVEATIDFDTGDYVTSGLVLSTVSTVVGSTTFTGLLAALGFKTIEKAYILATRDVNAAYTQAQWITANDTKTIAYFVDVATNGTTQAPRLVMFVGDNEHTAAAIDASAQVRIQFRGH